MIAATVAASLLGAATAGRDVWRGKQEGGSSVRANTIVAAGGGLLLGAVLNRSDALAAWVSGVAFACFLAMALGTTGDYVRWRRSGGLWPLNR